MAQAEFDEGECIKRWKVHLKDPTGALKAIGALLVAESQEAFRNQKFDGKSWRDRSVPNVYGIIADLAAGKNIPKRRFHPTPVLKDTGALLRSINFHLNGSRSVSVGSPLPYAAVLHEGGPIESEKITSDVQSTLATWLKGKGKKWASKLGFLLSKKLTGKTLKGEVVARPFLGLTSQSILDIKGIVRSKLFR
jgi:phage gpG-like protein